ncbi:hypothetical protein [Streptomyces sp. NPDC059468]|uniref:hypothetical protein n=1 Tax=Streptomyces sp. NPDC059468 TaxID=3346845 RepID=UPI003673CB9D
MTASGWSRRRTRRALRRSLTRFEVRLPSKVPGIGFAARITATVLTEPPYPQSTDDLAAAIRAALRLAAIDISRTCDPADAATARDVCGVHVSRRRSLATEPPVEYQAELTLDLLPDDQAAVHSLLSAQRRQAVTDILRRQTAEAMAGELADPAALLVRWIEQQPDSWDDFPKPERLEEIAAAFAQHRPEQERSVEYEALEVIREFLDSFQDPPQKRMVFEVLAAGMRHAKRPEHAARAEGLLNGHQHTAAPGADA